MTVGNYNLNQIWLQLGKYQQQLRLAVVVLLALYLIAFAAELTWRLLPEPESNVTNTGSAAGTSTAISTNKNQVNLAQIKRLNLFGDLTAEPQAPEPEVTQAPETNLNLTLSGVVASSDPKVAAAIIENRGSQNVYGINEPIEGTRAVLREVYEDKVIIRNGNRNETLMLDGIDYNQSTSRPPATVNRPQPSNRQRTSTTNTREQRNTLSREMAQATRDLQKTPTSFTDYIAISPHRREGQLQGYRISPGKKPKLFKAAGFKAGDVVVEINGLDLTDPQQSLEAMQALRSAQSLQLTVNRGDNTVTLYLDFPSQGTDI